MCELTMSLGRDAPAGDRCSGRILLVLPWPRPPLPGARVGSLSSSPLSAKPGPCRMSAAGRVRGSRSPEQWTHSTLSGPARPAHHWPRLSSWPGSDRPGCLVAWLGQELVLESFRGWCVGVCCNAGNVGVLTERFVGHGEEVSEAL